MGRFGMFVGGALVGAVASLLYAPRTGAETRAMVCDKVNTAWGNAQQMGYQVAEDTVDAVEEAVEAIKESDDPFETAVEEVQDLAGDARDKGKEFAAAAKAKGQDFAEVAKAKGQEFAATAKAKGWEAYGQATAKVQDAAENLKPVFNQKNDELREKIEEARARIAAQVAKNAEEATVVTSVEVEETAAPVAEVPVADVVVEPVVAAEEPKA